VQAQHLAVKCAAVALLDATDGDLPILRYTHTLSLGVAGMASWRYADKLVIALGVFAKKASIKCLALKEMKFTLVSGYNVAGLVETTWTLSRTVSKLELCDCLFVRHGDIESLIRSFPLCKSLRLRRCSWQSTQLAPMFSSLPTHTVSLDELEITTRKTLAVYDLSEIVEQQWLDTTGLKSLTYSVMKYSMAIKVFDAVKSCRLEKLRISCRCKEYYVFVFQKLRRVVPRVRSLTIAADGVGAPWSLSLFLRTFRALPNLERLTIATVDPISQVPRFWSAVDAICGSGRVYESLATVEFYFDLPRPASGLQYVKREELREKLPYLAEHGMLKVSDPNVGGMDWLRS